MSQYDAKILDAFLENQLKLFPEIVAEDREEAEDFLDMVCATVCDNERDVIDYMKDALDVSGMSRDEILSAEEVFPIEDGRYLIVEG